MSSDARTGPKAGVLRERLQGALGDRYVLEEELGAGGSGTVFAARDIKHDRVVALKVLRPGVADREAAERFLREIRIAARLTHPHIVPVFDSGEAAGLLYYVMPRTGGESLRTLLDREGRLSPDRAAAIAREVAEALEHAHRAGIVHRDVKPGNVLLVDEHALLTDFGVARALEGAADGLTVTGAALGTPAYMSPEQISGEADLEPRSDVFSLGCVLYEMLMGQRPFGGRTAAAIFGGHLRGSAALEKMREEVRPELAIVVERAMATDPARRYASAGEMAEALRAIREGGPRRLPLAVLGGAAVALVALGVGLPGLFDSPDLSDREGSVVVLPFGDPIQTPEERRLVVDLAGELTRQLNRWDAVRAVPQVALAGVTFDLGLRGPVVGELDDGLATARTLGVETLVALQVRIRGDSAEVTATRFDPRRQRETGRPLESQGLTDDPWHLAAGIAHGLLGLEGPVAEVEELRRQSSIPEALRQYAEGLDLLERWRLAEAERAFRRAVELDSTFAMAHHYLALDLYWRGADEEAGLGRRGPEAARLSRAALRHSGELPRREQLHVEGFNRFIEGDYDVARVRYDELLARDSTDVFAWLLKGIVEFQDLWLVESPDGPLVPRSNLNDAMRAFRETVRLNPGFHLGYGLLFDITGRVLLTRGTGTTLGLERPRDELVPPWESSLDPTTKEPFGLVYTDSLLWLPDDRLDELPEDTRRDGSAELLESAMRTLRRWALYAPEERRPHAELASWTVRQRTSLSGPQPPRLLDSLARAAMGHATTALGLTGDTLVSDLVTLANLHLAVGDAGQARSLVGRAVALADPAARIPRAALNPFLFGGDWETSLSLLEREPARTIFFEDPETGEILGVGGVEPVTRRLGALTSADAPEAEVAAALAEIERRWADPPPRTAPISRLRSDFARTIAPALAAHPDARARWSEEAEWSDPFWDALDASGPEALSRIRVAVEAPDPQVREPTRSYLLAGKALETGDPAFALQLLARVDSIPLELEDLDVGWGLRALALYRRGEALEALGDTAAARTSFEQFLQTRAIDDVRSPLQAAARSRLERPPGGL